MAAKKPLTFDLRPSEITVDPGVQQRDGGLNAAWVDELTEVLKAGAKFTDKIVCFHDGKQTYWLAAGFHRVAAAAKTGDVPVEATVYRGDRRSALKFALSDNATHGNRRTRKDLRKAVLTALADPEWGKLSPREIGRLCRCSHTYVTNLRREIAGEPVDPGRSAAAKSGHQTNDARNAECGESTSAGTPQPDPCGSHNVNVYTHAEQIEARNDQDDHHEAVAAERAERELERAGEVITSPAPEPDPTPTYTMRCVDGTGVNVPDRIAAVFILPPDDTDPQDHAWFVCRQCKGMGVQSRKDCPACGGRGWHSRRHAAAFTPLQKELYFGPEPAAPARPLDDADKALDAAGQLNEVLADIRRLVKSVDRAAQGPAGHYLRRMARLFADREAEPLLIRRPGTVRNDRHNRERWEFAPLETLYRAVKAATPKARCFAKFGDVGHSECRACDRTGWICEAAVTRATAEGVQLELPIGSPWDRAEGVSEAA